MVLVDGQEMNSNRDGQDTLGQDTLQMHFKMMS